jgi:hypothetical protein
MSGYLEQITQALRATPRGLQPTRSSKARADRYCISFVPIVTRDYKMGPDFIEPGIITRITPFEYLARCEDPSEMDSLPVDFDWEDPPGLRTYETVPGPICDNLYAIYGEWGFRTIEILTGETNAESVGELQTWLFPDGPNAWPVQGRFHARRAHLRAKLEEAPVGTVKHAVAAAVLEAHDAAMKYRHRWAQKMAKEAQDAQTKNGQSGRTFLDPMERDVFFELGLDIPNAMVIREEGEDFIRTAPTAEKAGATTVVVQQDPSLSEVLRILAEGQMHMAEALANLKGGGEPVRGPGKTRR